MRRQLAFILVSVSLLSVTSFAADRGVAVKEKPAAQAVKERRTALVIGNSAYFSSPLKNPANDARTVAKTLRDLGFSVDEKVNLTRDNMMKAIDAFGRSIRDGGVGLFYYAGHGMQVNGENYLLSIDAKIESEEDVKYNSVEANYVLDKMKAAKNGMNIVILDSCRDNPFARSTRSSAKGLATMNAASGTLIAYATSPGSVASDGTGQNGLYTEQLVNIMKKPGFKVEEAFKMVRSGVQDKTQGKQVPWESSSLVGDFYFAGKPADGIDRSKLDGLAEGSKERQAELARLQKLEAENAKQKEKEQAELAKKEKELAALDSEIAAMKSRLGSGAAGNDDSLDKMVAMVERKEADARKLEKLRKQRQAEEAKRQAEIAQLKKDAEAKRKAEIEADIAKFEKIANSEYGKDMVPTAWKSLTIKYASAEGIQNIEVGNVRAFRSALIEQIEFVHVTGGCFQMGDTFGDGSSDEKPVHEVCVDDYSIGTFEVTQDQWNAVMGSNPSYFTQCGGSCPVEQVSWNDVQEFLRKLNQQTGRNYRLPTEAEWEYAARSRGKSEKYAGGNDLDSVAWYGSNAGSQTHPVGQKQPNGLGIYDMSGNVWEWCQDWYDGNYYKSSPKDNPQGPSSGSDRVLRGGSWLNDASSARAAVRDWGDPGNRYVISGFRLARAK